jgi:hypothetical protein
MSSPQIESFQMSVICHSEGWMPRGHYRTVGRGESLRYLWETSGTDAWVWKPRVK